MGISSASALAFVLESLGTLSLAPICYLTDKKYCDFLKTVLLELLEAVPLAVRQKLWFQQDGAPAYRVEDVQQWFNATYP
jgi:hypothetical protein